MQQYNFTKWTADISFLLWPSSGKILFKNYHKTCVHCCHSLQNSVGWKSSLDTSTYVLIGQVYHTM